MISCDHCGVPLNASTNFCTNCGKPVLPESFEQRGAYAGTVPDSYSAAFPQNTPSLYDETADISNNKIYAVLCYLWAFLLIPMFTSKGSRFLRFHVNQGLVLVLCEICSVILLTIIEHIFMYTPVFFLSILLWTVYWITMVVYIIRGIVNAVGGTKKPLPVIGKIKILK